MVERKLPEDSSRSGMTIAESAIALLVASFMMIAVVTQVADGIRMQLESDRLSLAVTLAQAKMTQLINNPEITPGEEKGEFDSGFGMYGGYGYEIDVSEVNMDLAKIAEEGTLKPTALDDQLPAAVQNPDERRKKAGQSSSTETGGIVPVYLIRVKIRYPRGNDEPGIYEAMTYRETGKQP